MLARISTAQTSRRWIQGRVGPPCSCAPSRLHLLFFSLMLMTVKPQRPPAWIRRVLTQPLFTQAHNKSTTFLGAGDKSAARWRDNGERISRGLFRFSLVARLDNTSAWTKGATTGCFSRFVGFFWRILASASREKV